jgi:hypothetical protein
MQRHDPALVHEPLGDGDEVLEHRVLAVASLQPGHHARHELRVRPGACVDELVLLVVREALDRLDVFADGAVEEREPRRDEPLQRPSVEPREPRELVVGGEIERRHDLREHLGVGGPDAVSRCARQPQLPA